ncbi:MAG: hypothetical protein J6P36_07615 [Lachnospiraceae bacterium]|nr:hypothetical protein [Lachnospiraceae bacterium]
MQPSKILYISCNPESLARDLHFVVSTPYRVEKIIPVDMFPGTKHTEVCCLLERSE